MNEYRLDSGTATFDEINSTINPFIIHDEYFVSASNGSVLTVEGKTMLDSDSSVYVSDSYDQGTYAFHAADSAKMFFNGDIDVTIKHSLPDDQQITSIGANGFYAQRNA